jgi:glycosyltransferase involved in cell wall biosynthesis
MVLTEAWAQARPVLAQGRTEVLVGQVRRSGGGMWYSGFAEFEAALDLLVGSPSLGDALGRAGRAHVEREYRWDAVLSRYEGLLRQAVGAGAATRGH